ncbi:MAG TPA: ABC transporter ATP-binding protein [Rhodothermales bacterium]|nr:ABC transporter ATP-binding protein [Rhodothermales bacterium]
MATLHRLNPYLWKYRRLLVPGLLFTMISAGFTVAVPMVVRQAVDAIPRMVALHGLFASTPAADILYEPFFTALLYYGALILALSLASGLFLFLMRQTVVVSSRHIEYDLRNALYEHVQKLSADFFQRFTTGDVMTRSTSDIEHVRQYVGPALMYATRSIVITVAVLIVMFVISPVLTLWALMPMPLLAIAIFFMSGMIHSRSDALQKQYSRLTSRVQEVISGIRVIKAYTREAFEASVFDEESDVYRARALALARVDAAFRPIFVLIIGMAVILIVWVGGLQVMQGRITIGNIAEYIIYVTIMTWPVAALGFVLNMIQRAEASMSRLCEVLDTEPAIRDGAETDWGVTELEGSIAFENVSYRYDPEAEPVLRDVSFEVREGATLGIVGRTGSGKSTLVRMLPRLLDPDEGRIFVGGHDVRSVPLHVLRATMGYVPQEAFLFSEGIGENIAFSSPGASPEAIKLAAEEADLTENVAEFPRGFDTPVGERGVTLSGGQKQRTAIARALLSKPRIVVFDDALSAVDAQTEENILASLREYKGRHTLVIVSHRLSAVQDADLIIVLNEGRIVQRGSHADLMRLKGLYADMWRRQQLEEEIKAL